MKRVLLISALGLLLAHNAMASMENCRFALHARVHTTKAAAICTTNTPNAAALPCSSYVTQWPINSASDVYIVVGRAGTEGLSAASFGIDYSGTPGGLPSAGISAVAITYCADGLAFPNDGGFGEFPKPKGGVRVTWNLPGSCQTTVIGNLGVHAVVGAFYCYAYGPDQLKVTANNNLVSGAELGIATCGGSELNLIQVWGAPTASLLMGRVDFGGGAGYNPCNVVPTAPTTWGKIKTKYNH